MTNVKDPSDHMIASNDMYPLFDADGKVSGVAEISRSRNTRIKQVRDTLGLTADYTFEDIMGDSKPMADAKNLSMSFAASPYNVFDLRGERRRQGSCLPSPFTITACAGTSPLSPSTAPAFHRS